jgi:hypothetical protein
VHFNASRLLITEVSARYATGKSTERTQAFQSAMLHLIHEGGYETDGRLIFSFADPISGHPSRSFAMVGTASTLVCELLAITSVSNAVGGFYPTVVDLTLMML